MLRNPKLSSSGEGLLWNYAIPLDKASPGLPSASLFSNDFPLEQTTSSVKWESKEGDLISKGNGACVLEGLMERAGATVLFTLKRFPWVKAVTGPHSASSWSCQPRLSGWWRDRPQIDDGVARTLGPHRADVVVSKVTLAVCCWWSALPYSDLLHHLGSSDPRVNLKPGAEWENRSDKCAVRGLMLFAA